MSKEQVEKVARALRAHMSDGEYEAPGDYQERLDAAAEDAIAAYEQSRWLPIESAPGRGCD